MAQPKKLDLSRYSNNTQGQIDFAKLIEQAEPNLRDRIIRESKKVDPALLSDAMRRVVFFEEFVFLSEGILAEILSQTPPKILAYALHGVEETFRKALLKQIGFREIKKVGDEEERLPEKVHLTLVRGARNHILKTARKLEAEGKFSFALESCPRFNTKRAKKAA